VLATFAQCAEDPECAPVGACAAGCPDSTGTGTGTVYDECSDQNQPGCLSCCKTTHDQALDELGDFLWAACFCDPGAPCQIACDTYCADLSQPADPPCQACMDGLFATPGEVCITLAYGNCDKQPSCAPINECLGGC